MAPTFLGGKLKLKGKKKTKKSKHGLAKKSAEDVPKKTLQTHDDSGDDDNLTETERKSLARKKERDRIEIESTAAKSHRERVEEFNEKIGNLTELNDIPRVSLVCLVNLLLCYSTLI
jgi:protein FAM32A